MQRKYVTSLNLIMNGGGLIKIQWLVAYTWVQKLSRPQNKPDKHN